MRAGHPRDHLRQWERTVPRQLAALPGHVRLTVLLGRAVAELQRPDHRDRVGDEIGEGPTTAGEVP
jgi:hypothetical protein